MERQNVKVIIWKTEEECLSGGKTIVGGGIIGIIILLLNVFGGENAQMLTPILEQMNQGQSAPTEQRDLTAKELEEQAFINAILVDTEDVWTKIFQENNLQYKNPKLVLFTAGVETACGNATSASLDLFIVLAIKKCIWI